jgi:hypothetical protein
MNNWPDPNRPGVPANPEQEGWHWLRWPMQGREPFPVMWRKEFGRYRWGNTGYVLIADEYEYLGPVATPTQVTALREALQWMVDNDETNEGNEPLDHLNGQTWDEYNAYWIEGLNRAREALEKTK